MDHLVIPLDRDHTQALTELVRATAMAAGLADTAEVPCPHVTLIAHGGLPPDAVRAVTDVVTGTTPFAIHAHGYGFFTGDDPSDLSLHVPVVRTAPLDDLHRRLCDALHGTGTQTAPWSEPELWSPHITMLDRGLDPTSLGTAAAWLAQRHHPRWCIPVDRIALTGGWSERQRPSAVLCFTKQRSDSHEGP